MTAATAVSTTQPVASAKDPVESAEPFFAELDPTGKLQALRTRRGLICDFAVLCLERMGKIYQGNYDYYSAEQKKIDDNIKSQMLANRPPPLRSDDDSIRTNCARSKAILDHFNTKVRPNLESRRKELDRVYDQAKMKGHLESCFSSNNKNVISYIAQHLNLTHNAAGYTEGDPQVASLISSLVQIILGKENTHLPQHPEGRAHGNICKEHSVCIYLGTKKYSKWVGIRIQSIPYSWSHPLLKKIVKEETESSGTTARTEFIPAEANAEVLLDYSMETFFATMQFALCVERRLALKDAVITVLNTTTNSGNVWSNLINFIMDFVPPPKSAIEIVEDDS